jgi:hypothetical protein
LTYNINFRGKGAYDGVFAALAIQASEENHHYTKPTVYSRQDTNTSLAECMYGEFGIPLFWLIKPYSIRLRPVNLDHTPKLVKNTLGD